MKTYYVNCYKKFVDKKFLISEWMIKNAKSILTNLPVKSKVGRLSLDHERMVQGIYYLLKAGAHWKSLPKCFGSSSAVHRFFQKLVRLCFFENLWINEIMNYHNTYGLALSTQSVDCAHRKSPIGIDKSGESPVDRGKHGCKLSVLAEKKGITIGLVIGSSNQHDSKLFCETILSVPKNIQMPYYKEMHLDSAYDSSEVKTALFNTYYVPKIAPNKRRSKGKIANSLGYTRWFIEPVHSWMNRFRSVLTRFSKHSNNYLALARFAAASIIFNKI